MTVPAGLNSNRPQYTFILIYLQWSHQPHFRRPLNNPILKQLLAISVFQQQLMKSYLPPRRTFKPPCNYQTWNQSIHWRPPGQKKVKRQWWGSRQNNYLQRCKPYLNHPLPPYFFFKFQDLASHYWNNFQKQVQVPTKNPRTNRKIQDWDPEVYKPIVMTGDSNLGRIPQFDNPLVPIDSFPEANFLHIARVLQKWSPCAKTLKVFHSVGINNLEQLFFTKPSKNSCWRCREQQLQPSPMLLSRTHFSVYWHRIFFCLLNAFFC